MTRSEEPLEFYVDDIVLVRSKDAQAIITEIVEPSEGETAAGYVLYMLEEHSIDAAQECDLKLEERGRFWHFLHDKPITFTTPHEALSFYESVGEVVPVMNPRTGRRAWLFAQMLCALRSGLIHAYRIEQWNDRASVISAYRFRNEEAGKQLAHAFCAEAKQIEIATAPAVMYQDLTDNRYKEVPTFTCESSV